MDFHEPVDSSTQLIYLLVVQIKRKNSFFTTEATNLKLICATVTFGMGIDCPKV